MRYCGYSTILKEIRRFKGDNLQKRSRSHFFSFLYSIGDDVTTGHHILLAKILNAHKTFIGL